MLNTAESAMDLTRTPRLILLFIVSTVAASVAPSFQSTGTRLFAPNEALPSCCCRFWILQGNPLTTTRGTSRQLRRQGSASFLSFMSPDPTAAHHRCGDRGRRRRANRNSVCSGAAVFPTTTTATDHAATIIMSARHEGHPDPRLPSETRADFLGKTAAAGVAYAAALWPRRVRAIDLGGVEFGPSEPNKFDIPPEDNPDGLRSPRPLAYRVEYTDPPTTIPFPRNMEGRLVAEMASQKLLFFGVHGDSPADQQLAAGLMGKIASKLRDKAAIGLEQVERQFQSALDDYVAEGRTPGASEPGELLDQADARLAEATQWKERSTLPFDSYRPVFHLARSRELPLVALGVDSESVFQVMRNGMDSLQEEDRNSFVADFKGFVSYVRDKGFQAYADKLIFPSYERLMDEGLLGDTPPTRPNFFSARILVDEALASRAVEWVANKGNENRPLLVLQREDRVKFGFGASGRAARIAESFGGVMPTRTVLVNPTAIDSLSDNRSLRLALEYADDLYAGKPLANYLWFTKSPKVSLIPRMLNPENKGWLEKINLYELRGSAKT